MRRSDAEEIVEAIEDFVHSILRQCAPLHAKSAKMDEEHVKNELIAALEFALPDKPTRMGEF